MRAVSSRTASVPLGQHGVHDGGAGVRLWDAQHRCRFKAVFQSGFVLLVFKRGVGGGLPGFSVEITDFFLPDRRKTSVMQRFNGR